MELETARLQIIFLVPNCRISKAVTKPFNSTLIVKHLYLELLFIFKEAQTLTIEVPSTRCLLQSKIVFINTNVYLI